MALLLAFPCSYATVVDSRQAMLSPVNVKRIVLFLLLTHSIYSFEILNSCRGGAAADPAVLGPSRDLPVACSCVD